MSAIGPKLVDAEAVRICECRREPADTDLQWLRRVAIVLAERDGAVTVYGLRVSVGAEIAGAISPHVWPHVFQPRRVWRKDGKVKEPRTSHYVWVWQYVGPSALQRDLLMRAAPPVLQPEESARLLDHIEQESKLFNPRDLFNPKD